MARPSHLNLKTIRFEGEVLPNWAQLLDFASRLCAVPEETLHWFSKFTNSNGVEDGRTVLMQCELLRSELRAHRDEILGGLQPEKQGAQATQIYGAWLYSLDTMIQQASALPTCSWQIDGMTKADEDDAEDGGGITLRRV